MKPKKQKSPYTDELAAELHSDDGQDPRQFFRDSKQQKKTGRKAIQLCSQVADTLSLVLGGECRDEVLQNLIVSRVKPAPDASQLLVVLTPAPGSPPLSSESVAGALSAAAGWLRTEVAASITRKRAPRLTFQFVPALNREESQ